MLQQLYLVINYIQEDYELCLDIHESVILMFVRIYKN